MIGTQLRNRIRFFADKIYSQLGPGFSERVYHNAMEILLRKDSIPYESERIIPIDFEGHNVCLLYTSPSPRDLSTSRMPSCA